MDTDAHTVNTGGIVGAPPIHPRPHASFWFADGDVVLATDKFLFRVHRRVLSMVSSVFKNIFEGSGSQDAVIAPEPYEGAQLITLVRDKGDDVEMLLESIYNQRFLGSLNDSTPLESIIALLLLSTKYNLGNVRSYVTKQLLKHYPTTLREYEIVDSSTPKRVFDTDRDDSHFVLLRAAFAAKSKILLPSLYYACSYFPIGTIVDEEADYLDPPCLKQLLKGKEMLIEAIHRAVRMFVEKSMRCACTHGRTNDVELSGMEELLRTSSLEDISWANLEKRWPGLVCAECERTLKPSIEDERAKIWDEIPSFFGLPNWDTLRESCGV